MESNCVTSTFVCPSLVELLLRQQLRIDRPGSALVDHYLCQWNMCRLKLLSYSTSWYTVKLTTRNNKVSFAIHIFRNPDVERQRVSLPF
jgi:hypothetical protein